MDKKSRSEDSGGQDDLVLFLHWWILFDIFLLPVIPSTEPSDEEEMEPVDMIEREIQRKQAGFDYYNLEMLFNGEDDE